MRIIFLLLFAATFSSSFGQVTYSPSAEKINSKVEDWVSGNVYLANEDVLVNVKFAINPIVPGGILRVKTGGKQMTLLPRQVQKFDYYDSLQNSYREFQTFRLGRNDYQFMEMHYSGTFLSLLGTESIDIVQYRFENTKSSNVKKEYRLIFIDKEERIAKTLNRGNILDSMSDHKKIIKKYLNEEDLYLSEIKDAIKVISYCDSLLTDNSK